MHHLLAMLLDGFDAESQFRSNLLIGKSLRDQLKHLGFARSQIRFRRGHGRAIGGRAASLFAQSFGDGRAEIRVSLFDFANGFDQVCRRGLLEQIGGGTGRNRLLNMIVVAVGRENDNAGRGTVLTI